MNRHQLRQGVYMAPQLAYRNMGAIGEGLNIVADHAYRILKDIGKSYYGYKALNSISDAYYDYKRGYKLARGSHFSRSGQVMYKGKSKMKPKRRVLRKRYKRRV